MLVPIEELNVLIKWGGYRKCEIAAFFYVTEDEIDLAYKIYNVAEEWKGR